MSNSWVLTDRQKNIDRHLRCAANLFGHITPRAFLVLFNRYNEPKLLKAELMKCRNKLMQQANCNYRLYDNAIISNRVDDDKINEIIFYQRGKQFYIPCESELLKYENNSYFEATDSTQKLQEYLRKQQNMNLFSAEAMIVKLSWLIRIEEENQQQLGLLKEFHLQFNDKTQIMALLSNMSNNNRKWANCGYTPMELYKKMGGLDRTSKK